MSASVFLALALLFPQNGGEARTAGPADLPANTWVHVKTKRNPVGRSYSGVCYGGGYLFYFGGGHGSHPGNDVELYHVATNTWTQATECENWQDADRWTHLPEEQRKALKATIGGGSGGTWLSPKGRPLTRHTYQMHVWFPEEKAFYNTIYDLWSFCPEKREWKQISKTAPTGLDVHTWAVTYDPELRTLIGLVQAGPNRGVHVYDRSRNSWTKKCDTPSAGWSEIYTAYDSIRKVHVVFSDKKWWTLDAAAGKTASMKDLFGSGDPAYQDSLSLAYDPRHQISVAAVGGVAAKRGIDLWAYDARRDSWSKIPAAGDSPRGFSQWGLLTYEPVHGCFLLLNVLDVGAGGVGGRTDGLFAFRYDRGPAPRK